MSDHEPIDHHELEQRVDKLFEISDAAIAIIFEMYLKRIHEEYQEEE